MSVPGSITNKLMTRDRLKVTVSDPLSARWIISLPPDDWSWVDCLLYCGYWLVADKPQRTASLTGRFVSKTNSHSECIFWCFVRAEHGDCLCTKSVSGAVNSILLFPTSGFSQQVAPNPPHLPLGNERIENSTQWREIRTKTQYFKGSFTMRQRWSHNQVRHFTNGVEDMLREPH